jgi:hypothetical protein
VRLIGVRRNFRKNWFLLSSQSKRTPGQLPGVLLFSPSSAPPILYLWGISNLVEKINGFISEEGPFSEGSANRGRSRKQVGPLPGQKSIRLAKKGGGSSFPEAGFRRFGAGIPQPNWS